jgi:hypothetical protein
MSGGGEAENQQLRVRVAEAGDGLAPVVPVAVGEALFGGDGFAILDQARAFAAPDDLAVELVELARAGQGSLVGERQCRLFVFSGLQRFLLGFIVQ